MMVKNYNDLTQEQKTQVFALWQIEALKDPNIDDNINRYDFNDFNANASFANLEYVLNANEKVVNCLG